MIWQPPLAFGQQPVQRGFIAQMLEQTPSKVHKFTRYMRMQEGMGVSVQTQLGFELLAILCVPCFFLYPRSPCHTQLVPCS